MMHWLPFASLAYLIWSFGNLLSKGLISGSVSQVSVHLFAIGLWNLSPLLLIPVRGFVLPPFGLMSLILLSGILYILLLVPYYKALAIEEASRVVPLWRFTPLFILFFSAFTGERLDLWQLLAFGLLMVGGVLVSVKQIQDFLKPTPAFFLMLVACFLCSIYAVISKIIYLHLPYYDGFSLMRISVGFCTLGFLFVPNCLREFRQAYLQMNGNTKVLLALTGILELIGLALYNFAVSLAPVSLVSASAGIQALFVLLLSVLLSVKFPQFLREEISRQALTQKGFAIALIVVGTGIISLR